MKAFLYKIFWYIPVLLCALSVTAQTYTLGWQGNAMVPANVFLDPASWDVGHTPGDTAYVTADTDAINIHWKFGGGNRDKWIVCFIRLQTPVSLSDSEIIGIDVKGSKCNHNRDFSLKFEDGTNQALYTWPGLTGIQRWCHRLSVLKNQFQGSPDWHQIRVISLVVSSSSSPTDITPDSGTVSVRNLQVSNTATWQRAQSFEHLEGSDILDTVKNQALQGILDRQASNGLFYTWKEDNASWLYGQGLVLKLLSLEGSWENSMPVDPSAMAAEKLALFLIGQQTPTGYWPRAWNTADGSIRVVDEYVWMGDFPWIITGLVNYYQKSGDERVLPAIQKATSFLYSLIRDNGELYTYHTMDGSKVLVTHNEAYCAAANSLFALGDSAKAKSILNYIDAATWDTTNLYWREGFGSARPALFSNTWMAMLHHQPDDTIKAIQALSFAGKALDTHGPGNPEGLDGVGPVAVWYEGTLSYICAGGPGSRMLFDSLIHYRYSDGTLPAYNDSLGSMAGIWAVPWSSLDATAWLYYAASKKSPFKQYYPVAIPATSTQGKTGPSLSLFPVPAKDKIHIVLNNNNNHKIQAVSVYNITGERILIKYPKTLVTATDLDVSSLKSGVYILRVDFDTDYITNKIMIVK